nr:pentatricopeptide repeat-containing protein At1g50270 [Ipomoea batatas]
MSAPIPSLHEALISLLLSQKKWSFIRLKQIHSLFITCGLYHHNSWLRKLLDHCISLPAFPSSYALSLFARIKEPNAHSWNTMIKGYSMTSNPYDSIVFYAKMRENRVFPNNHTFNLLLKAFSKAKAGNPLQVFAQVVKFGFGSDHFVQNSLVSTFAVCGYIELSRKVFDEMQQRDVISYTALIDGFKRNNRPAEALELFLEMKRTGVRVDEGTIVSALCTIGMLGCVWFGKWLHGFYIVPGRVHQDIYIGSALVDMYSKCGFCDDASEAFAEMPCKNLVSWTALIAGYVNCERFKNALNAFEDMQASGLEPNQATLTVLLTACTKLGALDQGKQLEKHIDSQGLEINLALGSALIDLYAKCGCINDALLVFRKIPVKDVYVWTAIINGLAMHGEAEKCLDLFREMLSNGVEPDGVTFIGVLSACSHGGLVDEGQKLFAEMYKAYGIQPTVDHYGCMVDLLGRAGRLEEAVELIAGMPMEPAAGVWGALFGACMIHKEYGLGEWVGNLLIRIQPHHSGRYTLLANLHSMSQNWKAVAQVRKKMKDNGVEKIRGCSWIELEGVIHEFIAFDKSHAQSESVYMVLDSLATQLEPENFVLHNVHTGGFLFNSLKA